MKLTLIHRPLLVLALAGGTIGLCDVAPRPAMAQATAAPAAPAPIAPRRPADVEREITRLHRELKITPAQAPQWDAFAVIMRDNASHMDSVYQARAAGFDKMNAVDGLKSYQQILQAQVDDLSKLVPGFETLYAVLSPPQKLAADSLFHGMANRSRGAAPAQ